MAQFVVIENNGRKILWGEPEGEDGTLSFMPEELDEGELFWGEIPYDELKKFPSGMVEIDPDTFKVTRIQPGD